MFFIVVLYLFCLGLATAFFFSNINFDSPTEEETAGKEFILHLFNLGDTQKCIRMYALLIVVVVVVVVVVWQTKNELVWVSENNTEIFATFSAK